MTRRDEKFSVDKGNGSERGQLLLHSRIAEEGVVEALARGVYKEGARGAEAPP